MVSGATGLAFEIIEVLPLDPRNKVAIAIIIITLIILTNIIRRRCCPRTTPRVLANWEAFTQGRHILAWEHASALRHRQAVALVWSAWATLGNRIRANLAAATWQEWNTWSGRIRIHPWHLERRRDQILNETAIRDVRRADLREIRRARH